MEVEKEARETLTTGKDSQGTDSQKSREKKEQMHLGCTVRERHPGSCKPVLSVPVRKTTFRTIFTVGNNTGFY